MQKSCEKLGPPRRRDNTYSEVALLLREALWRKGKESSIFVGPESSVPSTDAAGGCALPSALSCTAASGLSAQPGSARACSRNTENTDD